jgi:hypothetical protein
VSLTLRPGEARFWAISPRAPDAVALDVPAEIEAGKPIPMRVTSPNGVGIVLDVFDPSGQASRGHSRSNISLTDVVRTCKFPPPRTTPRAFIGWSPRRA